MPLSEFALIERYFRSCGAQRPDVLAGIGDDAALLAVAPDAELVAATDTLVAGVHFPHQSPPASIGHRSLAVNLSDLAAMGARPAWALLALTLPEADEDWLAQFAAGLWGPGGGPGGGPPRGGHARRAFWGAGAVPRAA